MRQIDIFASIVSLTMPMVWGPIMILNAHWKNTFPNPFYDSLSLDTTSHMSRRSATDTLGKEFGAGKSL